MDESSERQAQTGGVKHAQKVQEYEEAKYFQRITGLFDPHSWQEWRHSSSKHMLDEYSGEQEHNDRVVRYLRYS